RERVGDGAGRADGGTAAAAHAQEGFDADRVALRSDGAGGADVDAGRAAGLAVATVRADPRLVAEVPGLLELADQGRELQRGLHLLGRVAARVQVALRQLVGAERGLAAQVEDQVVAAATRRVEAREVDRTDLAAGAHALAMRLAALGVDLQRLADRAFR